MLNIKNLRVELAGGKKILDGLDLQVPAGEVHVILGPNGAGKSSLARVLAGDVEDLKVEAERLTFEGRDIIKWDATRRALAGIFLAFQRPALFTGVNNGFFLKAAANARRQALGQKPLDAWDFLQRVKPHLKTLGLDQNFLERGLGEDLSGGEKKINEILQMLVLAPKLIILDEVDSGLDVDAQKKVAKSIKSLVDPKRSFIIITHGPGLINRLAVDRVHLLKEGRIIKSGPAKLAARIIKSGFGADLDESHSKDAKENVNKGLGENFTKDLGKRKSGDPSLERPDLESAKINNHQT